MNINWRIFWVVASLLIAPYAQSEEMQRTPFDEYPQVASQVFVFDRSMFSPYTGPSVARSNVPDFEQRHRIGVVVLAPRLSVFVDRIEPLIHGTTSLELTDTRSGVSVGKFDLGLISLANYSAKLLFNGQGVVYLHHVPTSVCYGNATRKFVWSGKKLTETKQALAYLGQDSEVFGNIKLFSSLDPSSQVVASLLEGTKITVVGIAPDSIVLNPQNNQYLPNLLIKTPLGLTGWYLPGHSGPELSGLNITQCN